MLKNFIISLVTILIFSSICYGATLYSSDQILNKVYSDGKLLTAGAGGTIEVSTYTTTIMKRFTLTPNTDSGNNLSFGAECSKWVILNMADTAEIYIKFDAVSTINDFKIQAGSGIAGDSKVTNIHAISADTVEVQAIGYKN